MNQKSLATIILLIIAVPAALILGQFAAMDPVMAGLAALSIIALITIVSFGRNVWVLIFLAYPFIGALNALPVSISVRDAATLMVAGLVVAMVTARQIRFKLRLGLLELSLLAVFLMIAQSFVRNPAGVAALGSQNVGGRSNFEMAIAAVLFLTLASQSVSLSWVKRSAWFFVLAQVAATGIETVLNLAPAVGFYIYAIYRPTFVGGLGEALAGGPAETSLGRLPFFQEGSKVISRFLFSLKSPLQLLNPFKLSFLVLLIASGLALATGFRSLIATIALYAFFSILVRRRYFELFIGGFAGLLLYAFLAVGNGSFFTLPLSVQRSLSVLPGNWDYRAVGDAEGSADWRYEMWEQALTTDRYIKNKLIGDGYAISSDVFEYQQKISSGQTLTPEALQEYYLLIGGYHSGPVETIRRIGYFGLAILLFCQIVCFREAYRTVSSLRGTEYFSYSLFAALPLLAGPFVFWFIVGGFHTEIVAICFSAAWLRMIQNSARAHAANQGNLLTGSSDTRAVART